MNSGVRRSLKVGGGEGARAQRGGQVVRSQKMIRKNEDARKLLADNLVFNLHKNFIKHSFS